MNKSGWWWKIIGTVNGEEGKWFWEKVLRKLGEGKETRLWDDIWADNTPLKRRFPRLFHLCSNPTAMVSDMGRWEHDRWCWEITWRRNLRAREQESVAELEDLLQNVSLNRGWQDRWAWRGSTSNGFTVKRAFEEITKLRSGISQPPRRSLGWSAIWKMVAPQKSKAMVWRLLWNRLPTMDNLRKRILVSEADGKCVCCKRIEETSRHFFLECLEIHKIWQKIV